MLIINYYNKVKEIIIRSSEEVLRPAGLPGELITTNPTIKMINIKIFQAMLKELRIKLEIIKMGLGPPKTMRAIE